MTIKEAIKIFLDAEITWYDDKEFEDIMRAREILENHLQEEE